MGISPYLFLTRLPSTGVNPPIGKAHLLVDRHTYLEPPSGVEPPTEDYKSTIFPLNYNGMRNPHGD